MRDIAPIAGIGKTPFVVAAAEPRDRSKSKHRTHMFLEISDIVPERLRRKVGWDMRHHFMAEKIIGRFGLVLPRDRELVRQLAVIYVAQGFKTPNPL